MRKKIAVLIGSVVLLLECFSLAQAQYTRVRVYNPGTYHNTRTVMSRRAAMRKVMKKHRKAVRKRRRALHQRH